MRNKSLFRMVVAAAAMAAAVAACDVEEGSWGASDGSIRFSVDAAATAGGAATRAPHCAKAPVMMLGRGGADTLYMHASVACNAAAPAPQEAQTRGVPVDSGNFADVCRNFGVTAYTASGGKLFMLNELIDVVSGGTWTSAEKRYWPADGSALDFFAHAPAAVGGMENLDVSQNDRRMSFSYTVPQAATDQPDIMFAYARCGRGGVNERGNVLLTFSHALAGVRFVAKDVARCTIKTITLKGLKGAGTCVCRYGENGKAAYSWTLSGGAKDFSQEVNVSLANQTTGEQPITDKNPETTFMLIPQRLDGATVEITVEKDGKTTTLTGSLSLDGLTEWQAGNIYTYAISTESINWEYVFEVTPTVTFKLGELQKTYGVTSYRYRVDDPSMVEAVPWTALGKDSVEKEPQNEDKTEWKEVEWKDKNSITAFTDGGEGSASGAQNYDIAVTGTDMRTTYENEHLLQKADPKGSVDEPYDLSTDGRTTPRSTANCYVVNSAGTYKLPLVYGNAIKENNDNTEAYSHDGFVDADDRRITQPKITGADNCILVWSDAFYMFKDVKLGKSDGKYQYLEFTIDKDFMQQANAIVAARQGEKILWSWHIWVTEYAMTWTHEVDDYNDANKKYRFLNHNLGWVDGKSVYYNQREWTYQFTQAKTGEVKTMKVIQEGEYFDYKDAGSTYYQWGRKDPIVALRNRDRIGRDDYRPLQAAEGYNYDVESVRTTIGGAIQHPNVYYTRNGYVTTWIESGFTPKLWDGEACGTYIAKDNLKNKRTSIKTIYDPSPKGFKVPPPQAFSVFVDGECSSPGNDNITGGVDKNFNGEVEEPKINVNGVLYGYNYRVFPKTDNHEGSFVFTATGQRVDKQGLGTNLGGPGEVGGLWATYGVYYMTCVPQSPTAAYTFCIRYDWEPCNVFTMGFNGVMTMARPVRCIVDE